MTIQFNTDKTVKWDARHDEHFSALITKEMKRHSAHITRIEVHLKDENGAKEGFMDIKCVMEARLEGQKPIAITAQGDSEERAILNGIDKLSSAVNRILDRLSDHKL